MSIKIDSEWRCPDCHALLDNEDCDQVRVLLKTHSYTEFSCDECNDQITADTSGCPDGELELNPSWAY